MADTFQLQVATPERLVVNEQVTLAELPGEDGYLGVLAGHAPLLSALAPGVLSYEGGGGPHMLVVDGGFLEVFDNHVRVLADNAELPETISRDRAQRDLEEASEALKRATNEEESKLALSAMKRAQARIDAAEKRGPGEPSA